MLLDYLPFFMQNVEEIKKIMEVSQPEVENINQNLKILLQDLFVLNSTENATKHYEKMFNIIPKFSDTLEKRQLDILVLYNQILPFTLETLKEKLNAICGENGYTLNIIYEKFILNVKLVLDKKSLIFTVEDLLERIVPVNIIINISIDYNVWKDLNIYNWKSLNIYRWGDIKECESIKNKVL